MPSDPAQLLALDQHESNKKVEDFYGGPSKHKLMEKHLIARIENAAPICNWDNAAKAQRLANTLKGAAYTWYEGLKRSQRLDPKDWMTLKKYFLKQYEMLISLSTLTLSLKEIQCGLNTRSRKRSWTSGTTDAVCHQKQNGKSKAPGAGPKKIHKVNEESAGPSVRLVHIQSLHY